jgi:ABC-type branched-subunit amino acid transport system substrate-binding protein
MSRIRSRCLAGLAALALVAATAGCASGSSGSSGSGGTGGGAVTTPGVTSNEIVIGANIPLTGPAAATVAPIPAAMKAYFAYVNAHGGVYGRKIVFKPLDDAYDPSKTPAVIRQLVLQDHVFAIVGGLGTPTDASVLKFLTSNKVPDLFVGTGSMVFNQPSSYPYTFGSIPDYLIDGKTTAQYVKTSLPGKKVCVLTQDDDSGPSFLQGVQDILGASGLASHQSFEPTNTNLAPQIGAFKGAGCQVIISNTIAPFNALAIGTAAQAGLHAQWVLSSVGSDFPVLSALLKKAAGPLLSGVVGDNFAPLPGDASNSWVALWNKVSAQYDGNAPLTNSGEIGYMIGYLFVEALFKAGKDLTRQGMISAMQGGGWSSPGLGPVRFSATDHAGLSGLQLSKYENGQNVPFGPVYTGDDGSGPMTPVTTPAAPPPASGIPS